ncbi:hypothetical protein [Rhodoblastus sp.]|uniref:hypothetical protein n=1 Tax=Rhodoblastus sp. TaxID=1962975 RepID=UPI003F95344A
MQKLIEIFRIYPLLSLALMIGPFVGGVIGAYLGFDNLKGRLETNQHNERVEKSLDQIKIPMETVRRYETLASKYEHNTSLLQLIIRQYDQLRRGIATQSWFSGKENVQDRIVSSEQIIENLRALLGVTQTVPGPGGKGEALRIQTAPNTFRVILPVPMRIPPRIEFSGLPAGVIANVIEKTNVDFTVIFSPQSITVNNFGFTADAEL